MIPLSIGSCGAGAPAPIEWFYSFLSAYVIWLTTAMRRGKLFSGRQKFVKELSKRGLRDCAECCIILRGMKFVHATVSVSLQTLMGTQTQDTTGYPLQLVRENGLWMLPYSRYINLIGL